MKRIALMSSVAVSFRSLANPENGDANSGIAVSLSCWLPVSTLNLLLDGTPAQRGSGQSSGRVPGGHYPNQAEDMGISP